MTKPVNPADKKSFRFFAFEKQEFSVVLLMCSFFFVFIWVFQMLRPLKKGMFIEAFGADIELYAKLLNIVVSALGVIVFTFLVNHFQRQKVIGTLCIFFSGGFLLHSYFVGLAHPPSLSVWTFYLMGDLLTTMMVAAFWAYLTDITFPDQAKRLYGLIGAGGVLGGWFGAATSKFFFRELQTSGLLMVASVLIALLILITMTIERLVTNGNIFKKRTEPFKSSSPLGVVGEGARLTFGSGYLMAIMGLMFFYEIGSQVNDYQFSKFSESLEGLAATQIYLTNAAFFANLLGVVVQLFLVSMIMRKFGVTAALLVLPMALMISSTVFFMAPSLLVGSFLFISDNGLNYSIQQTARESLYVVTSPQEKYKSRAFTNMFVQRMAKGLSIFILLGLGLLNLAGESMRYLSVITVTVTVIMIILSIYAGRLFGEKEAEAHAKSGDPFPSAPRSGASAETRPQNPLLQVEDGLLVAKHAEGKPIEL